MEVQINDNKPYIKLSKTSTGKYSWEVKKYPKDSTLDSMMDLINDLDTLNSEMAKKFENKPKEEPEK